MRASGPGVQGSGLDQQGLARELPAPPASGTQARAPGCCPVASGASSPPPQPSPALLAWSTSPAARPPPPTVAWTAAPAPRKHLPATVGTPSLAQPMCPPEGAARSPSAPTPHRALLGASPITEGCFCPQGTVFYSSSREVCVPADCNSRFPGWAPQAGLWASRHCPWLFSQTPGLSAMTWGPPGPRLGLAVTGWGPRWPSSDLASFPPACLGPGGEPVEVSWGPQGLGASLSPGDSQDRQEGGRGSLARVRTPMHGPGAGAPHLPRDPSHPPLQSHGVQDRLLPPGPHEPQLHPHLWRPLAGSEPWVSAPPAVAMGSLVPPLTARPHGQRGLPGVHL